MEGDMANNQHDHNCPCCGKTNQKVEQVRLPDGRHAERHINKDENGNEVVEIFAEEQRPLKLEERIVRETKRIVAKETREQIKDGDVAHVEVRSLEPEVPLQMRERIGIADHSKIVDGDYVRKDEIGQLVTDGVVVGVGAMMENMEALFYQPPEEVVYEEPAPAPVQMRQPEPIFNAQSVVENRVAEKKGNDGLVNSVLAIILIAQAAFFGYMFFIM
jgi:hypothetical protein